VEARDRACHSQLARVEILVDKEAVGVVNRKIGIFSMEAHEFDQNQPFADL
jgi:hypothetical protein